MPVKFDKEINMMTKMQQQIGAIKNNEHFFCHAEVLCIEKPERASSDPCLGFNLRRILVVLNPGLFFRRTFLRSISHDVGDRDCNHLKTFD
jgi:hypothetical protein